MNNRELFRRSEPKPEFLLCPDDQTAWVPVAGKRFNAETRQFEDCEVTRGQAKQAAIHDITSWYDWTTLRCCKVWMAWDPEWFDPEAGQPGCWVEVPKGTEGAHPFWRVEETNRV